MLQAQESAATPSPSPSPSNPYVSAWNSDMRHWQHQQAQAQAQAQSRNHVMVPVPVPVPVPGMMPGMVPVPVPVPGMFPGYGYAPYPYTPVGVGVGVPPVTPSQYPVPMLFDQQQQQQAQALNMQFMHHQHQAAQQPTLAPSEPVPVPVPVHVPHTRATATSAVRPSPTPTFQQATARVMSAQRAGAAPLSLPLQAPPTPSHQVGRKRKLVELTGAPGTSSLSPTGTGTSLSPPSLISPRLVSPVSAKAAAANAAAVAVAAAQRTRLGATDLPTPISRLSRNVVTPIALPASLSTPIAIDSDAEPPTATPTSTTHSGRARSPPSPVDASRLRHRASDSARRAKHSAAFQQLVAFATRYAHGKTDKATVLSTTAKLMQTFEERVSELTAALEEARERNATLAAERADLELDSAVEQAVKQAQQQAGSASGSFSSSSSANSSACSSSTCSPRSHTRKSSCDSTPTSQSSSLDTACEDALSNPSAVVQWSKPASLPHRQQARLVQTLRQKHIASTDSTASSPSSSTRSVDLSVDCSNSNSNSDEMVLSMLDSSVHQYMFLNAGVGMWCISITGELRDINNHALSRVGATRDFILHRQVMAEAAFLPKLLQQTPSEQQLACTQQHMYSGGAHYATGTGCVGPLNPYPETLTAYWQLLHKQKRVVRVRRRNFISSGHFYEGMSSVWLVTDPDTDEPKYLVGAWADADVMHLIDLRNSEGVSRATSLIENTGVSFSDMDKWMEQQQQIDIQHHARQHQLHHHHDKHSLDHSHSHPSRKGLASLDGGSDPGSRSSLTAATMPLADIDENSNSDSSTSDSDSDEMDHQHPPRAPIDLRRLHIDLDADSHSHEDDNDHDHDHSDDEQHTLTHSHQHMHHIKHLHSHVHERPNKVHVVG